MKTGKINWKVAGFSGIELIVAMGVMMVLIRIAMPAFLRWLPILQLSAAARQVATDLQLARAKAISQDLTFQVNFAGKTYVRQICNPSCSDDSGNLALPTGITFSASGSIQFLPRGISNGATTVVLSNGSAQKKWVCVNLIGRVKIQDSICT